MVKVAKNFVVKGWASMNKGRENEDAWSVLACRAYPHLGSLGVVCEILNRNALSELHPYSATYNIMINGLRKNGYVNNAIMLFRNLQRHRFIPEVLTYNTLINGLSKAR
ncbi:hypothetical protein Ahy_A02g007912 isoform G [Arachis hypogaea]|uniref:Pentatricopeptide repeat-containing protein n=1 Tax=Arachis hypogaea TaxID=3818 RepID=A0A445EDP2_ARAHY|nr:hypothetical protein Ahy_A02g007912 isoform G [Arachis hypogaea]